MKERPAGDFAISPRRVAEALKPGEPDAANRPQLKLLKDVIEEIPHRGDVSRIPP